MRNQHVSLKVGERDKNSEVNSIKPAKAKPTGRKSFDQYELYSLLKEFYRHQMEILYDLVVLGYPLNAFLNDIISNYVSDNSKKAIKLDVKRLDHIPLAEAKALKEVLSQLNLKESVEQEALEFTVSTFQKLSYKLICRAAEYIDVKQHGWFVLSSSESKKITAGLTHKLLRSEQYQNALLKSNLGLVRSIYHKNKYVYSQLTEDIFIAEANRGLLTAINRWSPMQTCKFSPLVHRWALNMVHSYIRANSRSIRLPAGVYEKYYKIQRCARQLGGWELINEQGLLSELAQRTQFSISIISQTIQAFRETSTLELDRGMGDSEDEEGVKLHDVIADTQAPDVGSNIDHQNIRSELNELLSGLKKQDVREYAALAMSFGLSPARDVCEDVVSAHEKEARALLNNCLLGFDPANARQLHFTQS